MTTQIAAELRALARELERVAREAPCYSIVWPIIQNTVDHICARAAVSEAREVPAARHRATRPQKQAPAAGVVQVKKAASTPKAAGAKP